MTGLLAQEFSSKGVPLVHNYTTEQYGETGKTWAIESAENGILYFVTDQGLLEFDGERWVRFAGSKGFTRSLLIANDSTLYTGSDKDFGSWERDALARFGYTSLNPFRESTKGLNEEFWGVYQIDEDYIFVSFENIYVYRNEQLTKIAAPSRFYGSNLSGETLYLFDENSGLFAFDGLNLTAIGKFPASFAESPKVIGVQEREESLIVVTQGQGLFRFAEGRFTPIKNEVSAYLQRDQVFSFAAIDDAHFAYGTILNGVYITNLEGKIIQHVNKQKGLLNNTILSLHYSGQGQLWLGMDFGIAAIDLNSDVTYFLDHQGLVGTAHTSLLHEGTFYLGTNQGLYTTDWEQLDNNATVPDFQLMPGSSGQVWALTVSGDEVLCGHDRGLFRVSDNRFRQLHNEPGILTIRQFDEGHLLTGNYNGISLFEYKDDRWVFSRKISPVQGSCNQIIPEGDHTLWINLPNFGIIKASLGNDFDITEQQIFPVDLFADPLPQLFKDAGEVKVITEQAFYTFRPDEQSFGAVSRSPGAHQIENTLPGAYLPIELQDGFNFLPIHNGFVLKKADFTSPPARPLPLSIRSVLAFNNDSTQRVIAGSTIPHRFNNLRLQYAAPQQDQPFYQYQLDHYSDGWSEWTEQAQAEFLNLPAGDYTFRVRAKVGDVISPDQSLPISIGMPWHQTNWAYALYALVAMALLFLNFRWQRQQLKRQKQQLEARDKVSRRLQAAAEEQENLLKRYHMLEDGLGEVKKHLRSKTIELAKKAKESDEKGRLLLSLKDKLEAMAAKAAAPTKFEWSKIRRMLDNYPETEDNSFSIQMEELHRDFLTRLYERFPELTTYDQRLCVYLRSGLTTREIAELMNVLPSSVNVSRSRLRKKLSLAPKEDLSKFLRGLG